MSTSLILPVIIASVALSLPLIPQHKKPPQQTYFSDAIEIGESDYELWVQRFRCERFYTIESRFQCYSNALRHSERAALKRK